MAIHGILIDLSAQSVLFKSKNGDREYDYMPDLILVKKTKTSEARSEQFKFNTKSTKRAQLLRNTRSRELSSLKPCRDLSFALLFLAQLEKYLRPALKRRSMWLTPMRLRPILGAFHIWLTLWRMRLVLEELSVWLSPTDMCFFIPNIKLETHALRRAACLNNCGIKTCIRKVCGLLWQFWASSPSS